MITERKLSKILKSKLVILRVSNIIGDKSKTKNLHSTFVDAFFRNAKKGVIFNSAADTPYNNLANSNSFEPSYTDAEQRLDQNRKCVMKKSWPTDAGNIIPKSWNFSWQK